MLEQLPKLRRMAGALAGSAADGDDLLQNTLMVAFERRDQWRGENLGGWLYAIMRHIDANRRRHDRVLPMMVLDEECGLADNSTKPSRSTGSASRPRSMRSIPTSAPS